MPKRVFICHKATQKCTCCTKPDCELWCAAQGTAKLRSSVSGKQFPSYQEAGLLQCIGHRQIGILKQGCITQLSWENESGVFLLNDQSSNQKYDASSKSGFLSSALVTFGVEGLRRGGSGPYPPGSRSITLPHQLCEPKPSLAVVCWGRKIAPGWEPLVQQKAEVCENTARLPWWLYLQFWFDSGIICFLTQIQKHVERNTIY